MVPTREKSKKFTGTYEDALTYTEDLINKSINYQKISDVPLGVFLSEERSYSSNIFDAKE